ncbi:hypothetical protein ABZ468_48855 [Streptomyces sp. NPDC005708]|uniref:hypothetical protein n=1 Tax=Streptomyces sp. NPDC005708 TaxID=3154564 RepID=UPI0033FE1EB2
MTETLVPPTATVGENTPLAILFDIAAAIAVPSEDEQRKDEQREEAVTAALHYLWNTYPDTLGKALNEEDWHGMPAVPGAGLEPSAVAFLGGGLWLHHTTDVDQSRDLLTLVAPCTCGNGYVDRLLDGEWELVWILTDLTATYGRFPHNTDRPHCMSIRRFRAWSDGRL